MTTTFPALCRKSFIIIALIVSALDLSPIAPASYAAGQAGHTKGRLVAPFTGELKPGDYEWHPEISPTGPVIVLVSLPDQVLYVYRNGVRIGRSTVSSGKAGKRTPTGVFTVLQKKVHHVSNIYKGAKMPHMQRLTWTGIALHAGNLPGYPASAGCVRMPVDFAANLYSVTTLGTTVIIADNKSRLIDTTRPGLLFSGKTGVTTADFKWTPEKAPTGPVSFIVSAPDHAAYVYRNGVEIGRAPVNRIERVSGSHVYSALASSDANGRREWASLASIGGRAPNLEDLANRAAIPPRFLADVNAIITPGTTLVITDTPIDARTHSAPGFNILTD
jgi:hypothetical protein